MLELRHDSVARCYEAPLQLQASDGCLIVDDLGPQHIPPACLLHRWLVPLASRIDHLRLHDGGTVDVPFETLVILSTNLEPEDLVDAAFLRRIPYKIEVATPSVALYRQIFTAECQQHGLGATEEAFAFILRRITQEKRMPLAAYPPRPVIEQTVATCRFMGQLSQLEPRFMAHAIDNLGVRRSSAPRAAPGG